MDWFNSLMLRLAPLVSGALVGYGVTDGNAEAIAGGAAALAITAVELFRKWKAR
ncbi:MAG: hypothetical protein [Wigfec virus K19_56]|nr:MAG: hypothetical protein [Wigfec virus K19_56]